MTGNNRRFFSPLLFRGDKGERRKRRMNLGLSLAAFIFAVVFIVSAALAVNLYMQGRSEQAAFDELAKNASETALSSDPYEKYRFIYEQNPDFIGWLKIERTKINYPVMFTPDDPEYYLRRAFDGTESRSGTPFIGAGCDIDSDCCIIYGHNMKNATMFGTLDNYAQADFYAQVPTFTFTTTEEKRVYEVFAALKTRIMYNAEPGFRYYYQAGELTENGFFELTNWLISNALYDAGIVPVYGDQIMILSTCSYHTANGRFIVAARRIDNQN